MSLSFQHILVPYDGTKTGDRAFSGAIQLAKKFSSKITILACMEKNATFGFFDTKSDKRDMKKRNKIMDEKLDKLEQIARKSDIRGWLDPTLMCSSRLRSVLTVLELFSTSVIPYGEYVRKEPKSICGIFISAIVVIQVSF